MSTIRANTNEGVYRITKFLGLNENPDGDTKLRLGEGSVVRNWRITRDLNLKRRPGTKTLYDFQTESPVMGLWYGKVNGKDKQSQFLRLLRESLHPERRRVL